MVMEDKVVMKRMKKVKKNQKSEKSKRKKVRTSEKFKIQGAYRPEILVKYKALSS
jgi:ribosome-associated protein YbcJ (S4-like RNA binding protein)